MPFYLPKSQSFDPVPAGTHLGICYRILDLGTQETTYKGESKKARQVMFSWELPEEKTKEGEPMMVSKTYTASTHKNSHMRADLESWRAKAMTDDEAAALDLERLLGVPAALTIIQKEGDRGVYSVVETVSKVMKGTPIPEKPHNPLVSLILDPEQFNKAVYEGLSDKLKEKIAKSPEYQFIATGKPIESKSSTAADEFDDEIPF